MIPVLEPTELVGEEDAGIWLSIGDLMSGLLLVFVLLFVAAILQLQDYIEQSTDRRVFIIQSLQQKFDEQNIDAAVDEETGDISIAGSVFFDENKYTLLEEGEVFLDRFIPVYSEVIFSNELIEEEIVRVVMEGHTSSLGLDHKNMRLSLERANSVTNYILTEMDFPDKERFIKKMQASGRGEIDADQSTNSEADRRVIFRFKFKGEDFGEWKRRAEEAAP